MIYSLYSLYDALLWSIICFSHKLIRKLKVLKDFPHDLNNFSYHCYHSHTSEAYYFQDIWAQPLFFHVGSPKTLYLHCISSCMFRVALLLEGESPPQSQVFWI
ncbi:hypothetical protein AMECASPLE_015659 [Ameca splendens]|uniref:Uncharacterized protein n=1 Tax=Ameca splendens TaxID=208324 RepID=A0ABV0ZB93_9TELE